MPAMHGLPYRISGGCSLSLVMRSPCCCRGWAPHQRAGTFPSSGMHEWFDAWSSRLRGPLRVSKFRESKGWGGSIQNVAQPSAEHGGGTRVSIERSGNAAMATAAPPRRGREITRVVAQLGRSHDLLQLVPIRACCRLREVWRGSGGDALIHTCMNACVHAWHGIRRAWRGYRRRVSDLHA